MGRPYVKLKRQVIAAILAASTMAAMPASAAGSLPSVPGHTCKASAANARADLSWCDLSGENLKGLNLEQANLTGASLQGLDLAGTALAGALLSKTNIQGAQLGATNLFVVRSDGLIGAPSSLPAGWQIKNGYLLGPESAPGAVLTGDFSGFDFSGLNLACATFKNANLSGAKLGDALLNGSGPNAYLLSPGGCGAWAGPPLSLTTKLLPGSGIVGQPASIPSGYVLRNGRFFSPSSLYSAVNLDRTWFNSNFSGLDLRGSGFGGQFPGSDFSGANLTNSKFFKVSLQNTRFTGANIEGVVFLNASLQGADLAGVIGSPALPPTRSGIQALHLTVIQGIPSSMPSSWLLVQLPNNTGAQYTTCFLVTDTTRFDVDLVQNSLDALTSAAKDPRIVIDKTKILTATDLQNLNMTDADLNSSVLTDTNATSTNLTNADLTGVDAGGTAPPADGAVTAAVTKRGVKFFKANLKGAKLANAKLANAGLAGVRSGGIRGTPKSLPTGWILNGGFLLGPKANLRNANLSGVDFSTANLAGANLTGANLTGAKLAKANLTGVISSGLTGTPASLPIGWTIKNGQLVKA